MDFLTSRKVRVSTTIFTMVFVLPLAGFFLFDWFPQPCELLASVGHQNGMAKAVKALFPSVQACGGGGGVGAPQPSPSITVTSPNGGETWYINHPVTILWSSQNVSGNVNIYLSSDGGASWSSLFPNTANDGAEPWTIPAGSLGATFRVRATSVQNSGVNDSSNGNFTIANACDPANPSDQCETYVIWKNQNNHNVRWAAATAAAGIHYHIKTGTNADMALLIEGSFEAWELESNGKVNFIRDPDGTVPAPTKDNVSTVAFGTITAPNLGWVQDGSGNWAFVQSSVNAAGVSTGSTWAWNDPNTGLITDVDTVLNGSLNWDDAPPVDPAKYWIPNTMVHEAGHWLDLADLCSDADPNCGQRELTMYYGGGGLGITKYTSLGYGDIAGLKALYP